MNPAILTASGRYFDFTKPAPSAIALNDIATALSRICRFTGHTTKFYSVAQHSVLVSHAVPEQYALQGLMHDASEAYLGDVSSPLKQLLPDYRDIEHRVEQAIRERYHLPATLDESVKFADLRLLVTERRDLMPPPAPYYGVRDAEAWLWANDIEPLPERIVPLNPDDAAALFIKRFWEIY